MVGQRPFTVCGAGVGHAVLADGRVGAQLVEQLLAASHVGAKCNRLPLAVGLRNQTVILACLLDALDGTWRVWSTTLPVRRMVASDGFLERLGHRSFS